MSDALTSIAAAIILMAVAGLIAVHLRLERSRTGPAALLEEPVRLPVGHPERWTGYPDATDVELAALHVLLWPRAEYRRDLGGR
jgi:hypothetical protein